MSSFKIPSGKKCPFPPQILRWTVPYMVAEVTETAGLKVDASSAGNILTMAPDATHFKQTIAYEPIEPTAFFRVAWEPNAFK